MAVYANEAVMKPSESTKQDIYNGKVAKRVNNQRSESILGER